MELISQCPLRVGNVVWRPTHGGWAFTVVCKATFDLRPEMSPLAAAQEPVWEADTFAETASPPRATDLVPFKKRPEVLVVGHAHAADGVPVRSLVARIAVGEIDKAIEVVGDRYFGLEGMLSEPARFAKMPLVWERAAGGPDTANPTGVALGDDAAVDFFGRVRAPNLFPAGMSLVSRGDSVPPANLGPISPSSPARTMRLNQHAGWDAARWNEQPMPDGIDVGYFNAAPNDQQRAAPFGDDQLYLEHLHPQLAKLSTRLAPSLPVVTVDDGTGPPQPLQVRCDTLTIDSDRGLVMLVWRAHLLLERPDRAGRVIVSEPSLSRTIPAWAVKAPFGPPPANAPSFGIPPASAAPANTPPFGMPSVSAAPANTPPFGMPSVSAAPANAPSFGAPPVSAPTFGPPPVSTAAPGVAAGSATSAKGLSAEDLATIARMTAAAGGATPAPGRRAMTLVAAVDSDETRAVLPFAGPASTRDAPGPVHAPPGEVKPAASSEALPFRAQTGARIGASALGRSMSLAPRPVPGEPPPPAPSPPADDVDDEPDTERPGPPPPPPAPVMPGPPTSPATWPTPWQSPAPPVLIGSPTDTLPWQARAPIAPPAQETQAESPDVVEAPAPVPPPVYEEYPAERCGAIAGRLAHAPATTEEVLRAEGLDAAGWQSVHERRLEEIRARAARRDRTPLAEYDRAYVGALEDARGPIALDEYARCAEAAERSAQAEELARCALPEAAWPHIHRVWIERTVKDFSFAGLVRRAIAVERARAAAAAASPSRA